MANRTIAERIALLEADRTRLEAAISSGQAGILSSAQGDMSVTMQRLDTLRDELARVEKSLQRLYRGGRGMVMDMSFTSGGSAAG